MTTQTLTACPKWCVNCAGNFHLAGLVRVEATAGDGYTPTTLTLHVERYDGGDQRPVKTVLTLTRPGQHAELSIEIPAVELPALAGALLTAMDHARGASQPAAA